MNANEPKPNTKIKAGKNELISEHDSEYVRYSQSIDSEATKLRRKRNFNIQIHLPLNQFLVPAIFTEKVKNVILKKKMILK